MARPKKDKAYRYRYVGRTSKMTPEVVSKLEQAAAVRATISESCFYAGISRETYYQWIKQNPELSDRLDDLRQQPFLKARQTIVSRLDDPNIAFRFMEKEKPEDYAERIKVEHSGAVSDAGSAYPEDEKLRLEYKGKLLENIRERAKAKDAQPTAENKQM